MALFEDDPPKDEKSEQEEARLAKENEQLEKELQEKLGGEVEDETAADKNRRLRANLSALTGRAAGEIGQRRIGSTIVLGPSEPGPSAKSVQERIEDMTQKCLAAVEGKDDAASHTLADRLKSGIMDEQELANTWMFLQEQQKAEGGEAVESSKARKAGAAPAEEEEKEEGEHTGRQPRSGRRR